MKLTKVKAQRAIAGRLAAGVWLCATLGLHVVSPAVGQPTVAPRPDARAELLNSQRIEQTFGSYGIEVLETTDTIRVSNLYSVEAGRRVGRTFAVVRYPDVVDPSFAAEHREIVGGGSIGAVFARRGWTVEKTHRHYGETPATEKVAGLMSIAAGRSLAVHVYVLDVVKTGMRFRYATIVEVHHPDYLDIADLQSIYGPLQTTDTDPQTTEIIALARAKMRD